MGNSNSVFLLGLVLMIGGVICIILTGFVPKPTRMGLGAVGGILLCTGITLIVFASFMPRPVSVYNGYAM